MAHLKYESGLAYRTANTTLTTPFDINDLFTWATEHDGIPTRDAMNDKIATLFGVKPPAYSKCSELTESVEFHNACDVNGNANVIAMKKESRNDTPSRKGKRANGVLTNASYQEIGKHVANALESMAKEKETPSENGTELHTTTEWVLSNFDGMIENGKRHVITERSKRDISVNAKLETANDRIRKGVISLHTERDMNAETIASVLDMPIDEVKSILASDN